MDISSLLCGSFMPTDVTNTTANSGNATTGNTMHASMAETLLPMLGLRSLMPVYSILGGLGLDPSWLLTTFGIVWALNKLLRQIYHFIYGFVTEHLMSTIHIGSGDDMYVHLMRWLALQPRMVNSRSLTAETVSKTAWEDEDESTVSRDQTGVYLNFSNQEAMAPPRFIPAVGLHVFWWRGGYYRLHRKQESVFDDGGTSGFTTFKDREDLVISCLGRNPEPIKNLLKHVKQHYYNDHHARTLVKRPSPQNLRRYGGRHSWQQVADRPVRDMKTVVLDNQQKMQILADINEYLHPATPRWYANRGIPLRRGYLFHGPPGTGKTSLSFALAGVFGLDIYVISLLEPTLTEEDLSALFSTLPRRCVVLLEDIDTAGLRRPADELNNANNSNSNNAKDTKRKHKNGDVSGDDSEKSSSMPNDWKVSDLAKALKKETNDDKKGISLSGLLNAIDGVASHEGRVLIMTTNVPESLDEALIRPGRVDLQVGFTNATREQAKELFIRMYEADQGRRKHAVGASDNNNNNNNNKSEDGDNTTAAITTKLTNGKKTMVMNGDGESHTNGQVPAPETTQSAMKAGELDISEDQLPDIAGRFADKIPEGKFSPAEIQGYLLKRKKHPLKAVEEVEKWVEALMRQKASRSKIQQVQ